jgi:plastocyanin
MNRQRTLLAGLTIALTLSVGGGLAAHAAPRTSAPTVPATRTVIAGFGDQDGAANIYAPKAIDIYAGDTVVWRIGGLLEPHTITFGPMPLLKRLSDQSITPMPQKAGPPQLQLNPQVAFPTHAATYAGMGFANSGLLQKGQSWRLTFTQPGTYHYYCLLHFPNMTGTVIVHPRPAGGTLYHVIAGDSTEATSNDASAASDLFFPRHLTIHVGDTVSWVGGFHTITFGPDSMRTNLERHLFMPAMGKNGQPSLYMNPRVAYPSGGATYDGTGFVSSGLLFMRAGKNSPPEYHLTFTKPGTFEYDCLIHPGMDGTITVLPRGA